jgi:hypothetical protein
MDDETSVVQNRQINEMLDMNISISSIKGYDTFANGMGETRLTPGMPYLENKEFL